MSLLRKMKLTMPAVYALCVAGGLMVLYACTGMGGDTAATGSARREIAFRDIGHKLLLHSGDSTSRVLPVRKLDRNTYRLQFAQDFTFEPDSLVAIVEKTLSSADMDRGYVVNVLECTTAESVFGFAIAKNDGSILPCSGRRLPKSCYLVDIRFDEAEGVQVAWLGGGVILLLLAGAAGLKSRKPRKRAPEPPQDAVTIGNTLFDIQNKKLVVSGTDVTLTGKECSLLLLFAASPNQVVDRSRLQKELWEDQGIIVGRSLDVFISRLRKKLEGDASLKLVNIHGKGYKLEISGE